MNKRGYVMAAGSILLAAMALYGCGRGKSSDINAKSEGNGSELASMTENSIKVNENASGNMGDEVTSIAGNNIAANTYATAATGTAADIGSAANVGNVIEADAVDKSNKEDSQFYITEITDELFAKMQGKSYKDNCTVPRKDLRYIHVLHKDLDGETKEGEMVVNQFIAEDVLEILKELYKADYPIEKIRLIDEYDASDEMSMRDNNSSSFNFRFISYTTTVSKHGKGLAVDINTLYNPYVKMVNGSLSVEPATAVEYTDRNKDFRCKIDHNDLCYKLFTEHGFEWGGDWESAKDYQHFEVPDDVIKVNGL